MDSQRLASILVDMTGSILACNKKERNALKKLRERVAQALVSGPELMSHETVFQSERIDSLSGTPLEEKPLYKEMDTLARKVLKRRPAKDDAEYRVFRRNTPTISAQLPGSAPSWGIGAEVAFSEGPFPADNGLSYWFDFYIITKTIAVYIGAETLPSILVPVHILLISPKKQTAYSIDEGSIWIRSNLFASAPAGHYTGLKISGGSMTLSHAGTRTDDRLNLPAGATINLKLDLVQQDALPADGAPYGEDARLSNIDLPGHAVFDISSDTLSVSAMDEASWELYQDKRTFNLNESTSPSYNALVKRILIPCSTKPNGIDIPEGTAQSPFFNLHGTGKAKEAAWTLPTAAININTAPAAAGIGGLAVLFDTDMEMSWQGLEGGAITPNDTWFQLEPGIIGLTAAQASNVIANQHFDLWENETDGFASKALLQFTDAFPLLYFCLSNGYEAVFTQADTDIQTDRPVKVNGQPFEIKGKDTFFLYTATDTSRNILLFDPNIIIDAALDDDGQTFDPDAFESRALALSNALLTVTKPVSYYLAGRLKDSTKVENGNLVLLHGLYYFLPTLPDPYAANLAAFLRHQQTTKFNINDNIGGFKQIIALLLCTVSWPDTDDLNADVSYQFFPVLFGRTKNMGFQCGRATVAADATPGVDDTNEAFTLRVLAARNQDNYNPAEYENPWEKYLSIFGQGCFSLLDVSTNADLMGINYGVYNRDYVLRMTHQAVDVSSQPPIPYQIEGMDLKASGQFVKAFTVPHISWEPVINLSDIQEKPVDPPQGFLGFPDDGGPTRIFNTSARTVTLAPIPVTNFLIEEFSNGSEVATFSIYTLPFGLNAMARINPDNHFPAGGDGSEFALNQPKFETDLKGGIQLKTTGAYNEVQDNLNFEGNTLQRTNLISSNPNNTSVLGESVTGIFNNEFSAAGQFGFFTNRGVPLERIDFSGYGASMFSNWLNSDAKFAQTSQAKFDVLIGRTAHEVIQVRSVIYPWGIYVVRTITLFRVGSGYVYRVDSGWRAETDGEYDFNFSVEDYGGTNFANTFEDYYAGFTPDPPEEIKNLRPYAFYPGVVKRISNVQNIRETTDFPNFNYNRPKVAAEAYMDENGKVVPVEGTPELGADWNVTLTPVFFTANVKIDDVKEGAVDGTVLSKEMVGYVQITPAGTPIPRDALAQLLRERPEISGAVDCLVDIGQTGQTMRISRVEINNSLDANFREVFAGAAKGTPVLPKDGSWAVALHNAQTEEVTPISETYGVPLIRGGEWLRGGDGTWSANQLNEDLRLADPVDLLGNNPGDLFNFAFIQNTGSQKTLFSQPAFEQGLKVLKSATQHFADAYHLLNSKGIFPNLNDIDALLDLDAENISVNILKEGYKLIEKGTDALANPVKKALKKVLPKGPWYWVGSANGDEPVKIYLRYSTPDAPDSILDFDIDSEAKKWVSAMNDTSIVVDLGDMEELFIVRGSFNSEKGNPVSVDKPILEVGPDLKPIYDVLVILVELSQSLDTGSYGDLLKKGLEVAMSNSPETWDYKFSAEKEIPLLRFPPPALDSPTSPLRLEASMALGAYFNMDTPTSLDVDQLIPSAGAYVEFFAQLSVMCVSIAAATVYAVGQTEVKIYGDIKSGPGIAMRHGFGVELSVGLPVVGSVSLLYMVGIDMDLNTNQIEVGAFLLFRGRAEILGGIITVTIYIEAQGTITRQLPAGTGGETNMEAQVTFGLDISIFLVINISFEESWKETRQIG